MSGRPGILSRWASLGQEARWAVAALALAAGFLLVGAFQARQRFDNFESWRQAARAEYELLWGKLRFRAAEAGRQFAAPPATPEERLASFGRLSRISEVVGAERASIRLVDADGEPVAWAGSGWSQEPRPLDLPRQGAGFRAGFTAVTLFAVEPIDAESRRPWRVVAGQSFATDRWPFASPGGVPAPADFRWSLVAAGTPAESWESWRLEVEGLPTLVATAEPQLAFRWDIFERWWRAVLLGLLLLFFLIGLFWLAGRARLGAPRSALAGAALGAASTLFALALAGLYQRSFGALDLGADLWPGLGPFVLRVGLAAVTLVGFLLIARRIPEKQAADGGTEDSATSAWLAFALLLLAARLVDHPAWSAAMLLVAGWVFGSWLSRRDATGRVGTFTLVLVLAALSAGVGWEISYRLELKREIRQELVPRLEPPGAELAAQLSRDVAAYLSGLDLARLAGRSLSGLDVSDLAYAVWRDSPLARRNALSAMSIVAAGEAESQLFTFGMPFRPDGEVRWPSVSPSEPGLPVWDERLAQGEEALSSGGQPWGRLRWWLVPRPGFGLPSWASPELLLRDLLKGTPGDPRSPTGLPAEVLYALYSPAGRALISPWRDQPPAPPLLVAGGERLEQLVRTPAGFAWAFARRGEDGIETLYLPRLSASAALERVTTQAATVLLFGLLLAASMLLLTLPRAVIREVFLRGIRSYSRRLVLVYTALLLVPLLFLNLVLLRAVGASLSRAHEERGEQAVLAAQRAVVDKILAQPIGFGVETALSTDYLKSLAREVDHDVTVYFGSDLLASSTGELFSSGLLPHRIPGEVYARMVLEGFGIAERTGSLAGAPYLELYTPARLQEDDPATVDDDPELFLSVPLLAQQEDTAAVLSALSRRAVVATAALLGLLLAVGGRLARNFTKPLSELVEGTRRIAAGAPSLDLAPTELELAALVEAVDDMAGRIARSRGELLREKAVVERMVDSITSAVVSLDFERRVMMSNRVATELLGLAVGDSLPARVGGDSRLAPLAAFLSHVEAIGPREPQRETVRLPGFEGGEREWTLVWVPLPGPGEPAALLVVEDSTEVFRGQRLTAWAEMARIIAHEIKNPLTPIRLSTEHLRQVWRHDPERFGEIFDRCVNNILQQVDELQQIASEFSIYSRIPRIETQLQDLRPALGLLVEGYRVAPPPGVAIGWQSPQAPVMARFDERLLLRAVRNLLENAVRAAKSPSPTALPADPAAPLGKVELVLVVEGGEAVILVEDNGSGVPPELLQRIFDPYFSTHDTGTGLGLPIARRVVEEHNGTIVARNRVSGGLVVEIRIPLA